MSGSEGAGFKLRNYQVFILFKAGGSATRRTGLFKPGNSWIKMY